jgi:hypothetical protein
MLVRDAVVAPTITRTCTHVCSISTTVITPPSLTVEVGWVGWPEREEEEDTEGEVGVRD